MNKLKKIHVIFKTHLDIGFTDMASDVIDKYFHIFVPEAIRLSKQLKLEGGKEQFIWTTGSYLIYEYLKQATNEQRKEMEEAIHDGRIAWHGLPFTTHTELMDSTLFEYGLSISKRLDAQYGKQTIAAKMTDVPGHTKGIISYMQKSGIQFLHLGVNPASPVPNVPDIFVWKGNDGLELIVNYAKDYGTMTMIDGLDEAMYFAHTGDNAGPSSIDAIKLIFKRLSEQYPGTEIVASTIDAFAKKVLGMKDRFPVVTEEIGDSWIHGGASDPLKIANYRELLRLRDKWVNEKSLIPNSEEYNYFCDSLILVPEHTWGMDEKKHLTDFKNYSISDFKKARAKNFVSKDAVPDMFNYIGYFAIDNDPPQELTETIEVKGYKRFESSWKEQRAYLDKAIQTLAEPRREEANKVLENLKPSKLFYKNGIELKAKHTYQLGCFQVEFGYDGAICKLVDASGKTWADDEHQLGQYEYETIGTKRYETWFHTYVQNRNKHYSWADPDFGKPGMEFASPTPKDKSFVPQLQSIASYSEDGCDWVLIDLAMSSESAEIYGAPKQIQICYQFFKHKRAIDVTLQWFDKQAFRLPEASWFSFCLKVDNPNMWKMDKLGEKVSPLFVVKNGNRSMHAVNSGVYYDGCDGCVQIETKDAPILSPGEKRMLKFDQTFADLERGMHFNLHNNVWGTNFPMWFEENMKFRFSIIF